MPAIFPRLSPVILYDADSPGFNPCAIFSICTAAFVSPKALAFLAICFNSVASALVPEILILSPFCVNIARLKSIISLLSRYRLFLYPMKVYRIVFQQMEFWRED